jgi:hypothetical protein
MEEVMSIPGYIVLKHMNALFLHPEQAHVLVHQNSIPWVFVFVFLYWKMVLDSYNVFQKVHVHWRILYLKHPANVGHIVHMLIHVQVIPSWLRETTCNTFNIP